MGQYYRPTIIDADGNMQVLSSHGFGSGAKLTEHSWIGNELVNAVLSLVHSGRKHVAWIGDYSDDPYVGIQDAYSKAMPYGAFIKYYEAAWGDGNEGKYEIPPGKFTKDDHNILDYGTEGMYLVNHDRYEYIALDEYIRDSSVYDDGEPWCINPLPLLTACGNNRGGGDFHSSHTGYENVGIWAFASIEYTSNIPEGYTKKNFKFIGD